MSYILDALQKSETERRQGETPDINRPLQMVNSPRRRRQRLGVVLVALGLFANAAVLGAVYWNELSAWVNGPDEIPVVSGSPPKKPEPASKTETQLNTNTTMNAATSTDTGLAKAAPAPGETAKPTGEASSQQGDEQVVTEASSSKPTVIMPSQREGAPDIARDNSASRFDYAPDLGSLPLSFQRDIPDLRFSSHVFASDPSARRVMINGRYLAPGDTFSGIRVESITDDGVVLKADGRRFHVGVVRNWSSP